MATEAHVHVQGVVGRFFITPHAVARFRERAAYTPPTPPPARLSYEQARDALIAALDADGLPTRPHPHQSGVFTLYVGGAETPATHAAAYRFRAVVDTRALSDAAPLPSVVTIRHYKAPPVARATTRRQRPDNYWQRRKWHIRAVVWEFAGTCTREWMAAEIARRTGKPISLKRLQDCIWSLWAAPTKHQGWLRPSQVADALGISQQQVTALIRAGRIPAHRNPGGRWWLIAPAALHALLGERFTHHELPPDRAETVLALGRTLERQRTQQAQRLRDAQIAQAIAAREQAAREQQHQQRAERREQARQGWLAARAQVTAARMALQAAEQARASAWAAYHGGDWRAATRAEETADGIAASA